MTVTFNQLQRSQLNTDGELVIPYESRGESCCDFLVNPKPYLGRTLEWLGLSSEERSIDLGSKIIRPIAFLSLDERSSYQQQFLLYRLQSMHRQEEIEQVLGEIQQFDDSNIDFIQQLVSSLETYYGYSLESIGLTHEQLIEKVEASMKEGSLNAREVVSITLVKAFTNHFIQSRFEMEFDNAFHFRKAAKQHAKEALVQLAQNFIVSPDKTDLYAAIAYNSLLRKCVKGLVGLLTPLNQLLYLSNKYRITRKAFFMIF